MPMLAASPISWRASERIAKLPVKIPPINSKAEKKRFSKNAVRIRFWLFIVKTPGLLVVYVSKADSKDACNMLVVKGIVDLLAISAAFYNTCFSHF